MLKQMLILLPTWYIVVVQDVKLAKTFKITLPLKAPKVITYIIENASLPALVQMFFTWLYFVPNGMLVKHESLSMLGQMGIAQTGRRYYRKQWHSISIWQVTTSTTSDYTSLSQTSSRPRDRKYTELSLIHKFYTLQPTGINVSKKALGPMRYGTYTTETDKLLEGTLEHTIVMWFFLPITITP